jgi:hypothetical protein
MERLFFSEDVGAMDVQNNNSNKSSLPAQSSGNPAVP